MSNPEPLELAYLAGFFDGEGCVRFPQHYSHRPGVGSISTRIGNTDRKVLERFASHFGGKVRIDKAARPGYRTFFSWDIFGDNARRFLQALLPYLAEKKPQAELALSLCDLRPEDRIEGMARLKSLKRVDQGAPTP